ASRPSFLDGRDAHPTNLWKLFNSHSLVRRSPILHPRSSVHNQSSIAPYKSIRARRTLPL
ncbi:hypothetical protein, partial [Microcoleus sp. C2D2]|uniref:hypothetical protein n=1 Tax=Microcoleus sp. C2D2 TaxID=3055326 RepID=UPI002FD18853